MPLFLYCARRELSRGTRAGQPSRSSGVRAMLSDAGWQEENGTAATPFAPVRRVGCACGAAERILTQPGVPSCGGFGRGEGEGGGEPGAELAFASLARTAHSPRPNSLAGRQYTRQTVPGEHTVAHTSKSRPPARCRRRADAFSRQTRPLACVERAGLVSTVTASTRTGTGLLIRSRAAHCSSLSRTSLFLVASHTHAHARTRTPPATIHMMTLPTQNITRSQAHIAPVPIPCVGRVGRSD